MFVAQYGIARPPLWQELAGLLIVFLVVLKVLKLLWRGLRRMGRT